MESYRCCILVNFVEKELVRVLLRSKNIKTQATSFHSTPCGIFLHYIKKLVDAARDDIGLNHDSKWSLGYCEDWLVDKNGWAKKSMCASEILGEWKQQLNSIRCCA